VGLRSSESSFWHTKFPLRLDFATSKTPQSCQYLDCFETRLENILTQAAIVCVEGTDAKNEFEIASKIILTDPFLNVRKLCLRKFDMSYYRFKDIQNIVKNLQHLEELELDGVMKHWQTAPDSFIESDVIKVTRPRNWCGYELLKGDIVTLRNLRKLTCKKCTLLLGSESDTTSDEDSDTDK